MHDDWDLWAEFCEVTGREAGLGERIGGLLQRLGVLPCGFLLDVGCGTGVFTAALSRFGARVAGIDPVDTRTERGFPFTRIGFEDYAGERPDVIVFKQSYHLLAAPAEVSLRHPGSTLVVVQMPKPDWSDDPAWSRRPYDARQNARAFAAEGRRVEVVRIEQSLELPVEFLERMYLGGYVSDLRRLDPRDRERIWERLRPRFAAGEPFEDLLDVIVAWPAGNGGDASDAGGPSPPPVADRAATEPR